MIELDHLSYSSLSLYAECPAKWRFKYVQKITTKQSPALIFGSAVHDTIELLLMRRFEGWPMGNLVEAWARAWHQRSKGDSVDWSGDLPEELENMGAQLFGSPDTKAAIESLRPALWGELPAIEQRITLSVPGVPLPIIGYLDMLADDGVIVDFKTAARKWTHTQAQQETQPLFYLAALNQMGVDHTPGRFRHIIFTKGRQPSIQILETERSTDELLWLMRVIAGIWRAIEAEHFPMNPKACFAWGRPCEYLSLCRGKRCG